MTGGGLIRSNGGWRAVEEAYRDGIRLATDKRILGSSELGERALKGAGEERDRRVGLHSAGIDLSAAIEGVCRHLGVDTGELPGPAKRAEIARARALIACMATGDLSIPGSEVARRLNVDRSAVSRAIQRVHHDAKLMVASRAVRGLLTPERSQQ